MEDTDFDADRHACRLAAYIKGIRRQGKGFYRFRCDPGKYRIPCVLYSTKRFLSVFLATPTGGQTFITSTKSGRKMKHFNHSTVVFQHLALYYCSCSLIYN